MPAERRKRLTRHETLIRSDDLPERIKPDSPEDQVSASSSSAPTQLSKKAKQQLRHSALLDRLEASRRPYSKSHAKRLKRKAKEELVTDLSAIKEAIAAVDTHGTPSRHPQQNGQDAPTNGDVQRLPNTIGEGKGKSLTNAKRKRTLQAERLRHSLVRINRDFIANPFDTIRSHAKNTLVEHQNISS